MSDDLIGWSGVQVSMLRGRAIMTPLLLIAAKTMLLPILCKVRLPVFDWL